MRGRIYAADTSLIVNLWIYTAVPITALNTKEFAPSLVMSSNCPRCGQYRPDDVTSAEFIVAVWELGEESLCGRFPQVH
jgi:hypothetical protein